MKENLNGKEIIKTYRELPVWKENPISNSYVNKPVLDFNGFPVFAELYALREFKENGFDGIWVDSFRKKFPNELPEKK